LGAASRRDGCGTLPAAPSRGGGAALARAKHTQRAEARRRYRAAQAAELEPADAEESDEGPAATSERAPAEAQRSGPLLRMPDIRADLAALPAILRAKPLLWLVAIGMVAALAVGFVASSGTIQDPTLLTIAVFFFQTMLYPPALVPIFIAGFIAPRASYLIGLLFGLLDGILFSALAIAAPGQVSTNDVVSIVGLYLPLATVSGGVIGGFAAWYRAFLQRSAQRRREAQGAQARKRRAEQKTARSRYPSGR
jgi:xanthosine utilization system XapX-like protein